MNVTKITLLIRPATVCMHVYGVCEYMNVSLSPSLSLSLSLSLCVCVCVHLWVMYRKCASLLVLAEWIATTLTMKVLDSL